MRQVLQEVRDSQNASDAGPYVGFGDGAEDGAGESPQDRVAALEDENRALRETVKAQAEELEALRRRVAELEERAQSPSGDSAVDDGQGLSGCWRPPRRGHGLPDSGVDTLEQQHDEEHAFGPVAPLEAEWRAVRAMMGDGLAGSRVDRAIAAVRRLELEAAMLREFRLTLPPETEPLDVREGRITSGGGRKLWQRCGGH